MYQISLSAVNIITAIAASGLPFVLGRRVAEFRAIGSKHDENKAVSASLLLGTALSAALCIIFLLSKGLIANLYNSSQIATICMFLLPAAFANCFYATFRGALWGKQEFVAHSSLEIFEIAFRIVLALLLFQNLFTAYEGTLRAAMVYSSGCVLTALLSFVLYRTKKGGFANPKLHIKPIVKSALAVSGIRIAGTLLTTVLAALFTYRMTKSAGFTIAGALAEYGILNGMTLPLISFPIIFVYAITTTLVPVISAEMKIKNFDSVRRHLSQSINYSILFGGLAIGIYVAFGSQIGMLIFANERVGGYLRVSCWIMIPLALSALTTNLQNSMSLEYHSLTNYVIGAVLMLACVWILPKYTGAYSLIIATGASMTVTALLNIRQMSKKVGLKPKLFKTLSGVLTCSALAALLGALISNLLNLFAPLLLCFVLGALSSIISFLALVTVFNVANVNYLWQSLLSAAKEKRSRKAFAAKEGKKLKMRN